MAKAELPSPEVLRQLLRYEPETGKLFWKERGEDEFTSASKYKMWNTKYAGQQAFTASQSGYLVGKALGYKAHAHRVIWAIHYGIWPRLQIDHINRIRSDNRIENLRDVTAKINNANKVFYPVASGGERGVYLSKSKKAWCASVGLDGRTIRLGTFPTKAEAIAARCAAEIVLNNHPTYRPVDAA